MNDLNIGEKIAQYRKSKDLSIRELAKMADVTPSLLSQIERGLANPSVNSLKSIANALNAPLFTFFTSEVMKEDLIVRGNNRYEMLAPGISDNLEFAIMNLSPKSSSCTDYIHHNGYEIAYVLEGKVTLHLDGEKFDLEKEDSVKIPIGMKHKWENDNELEAKIIFAVIL